MGQAQLLLIVLGVVLVGIAIIAGIQAYDQNNRKASLDALTHDAMRIATDLQTWAQKPVQFGGPNTYADFTTAPDGAGGNTNATLNHLGYTVDATSGRSVNANGECALAIDDATTATITCGNDDLGVGVVVEVVGLDDTGITQQTRTLEGYTWGG